MTVNLIGLTREVYKGLPTTLCAGCGHNSITNHLIKALFDYGIEPHKLAKMSGIGCSSKTPAYFVEQAHGFNSLHGRMPSAATGAKVANRDLVVLGISGDGDTASIGIGQYCHMIRRNVDVTYIIENNGCYGLTKGQFSATADVGSTQKSGKVNEYSTIDVCGLAIELGATFVARSFSGDGKQLVPLLQAAFSHRGTAIIDIVSPCVTFNDHQGSTKSYAYVKDHDVVLHTADYIASGRDIVVDYEPGSVRDVELEDGSHILLRKLDTDYDPTDAMLAMRTIHDSNARGEFVTGLLYVDTKSQDLCEHERLPSNPLVTFEEDALRIDRDEWDKLMQS
ncbi:MAG: 2-oxoacid:ferredoxin oxidoreductase subunit beta [Candidatus Eremiobacteraeota bacterium]|nr:2-oxoacid:ferredoxin oxidoreductase subunit beta [Candidatus Eremiobacteraeota bacterium]